MVLNVELLLILALRGLPASAEPPNDTSTSSWKPNTVYTKHHLHATHATRATIHLAFEVGTERHPLQRAGITTVGDDGAATTVIWHVLHLAGSALSGVALS